MSNFSSKYPEGVQRVSSDTPFEDIVYLLKRDGGVFIKNYMSKEIIQQMNSETKPFMDKDGEWKGSFFPAATKRCAGLAGRAPSYVENMLCHPLGQKIWKYFLETKMKVWVGDEQVEVTIDPVLHSAVGFRVGPGAEAQPLHRDDYIHHNVHDHIDEWVDERDSGRETAVGIFVAGCQCTYENGATQFIPGSHKWDMTKPGLVEDCIFAEMPIGDAFVMLTSAYHGGGTNRTENEYRILYGTFMTRGHLRQEENQYLVVEDEFLRKYDDEGLKNIGYNNTDIGGWIGEEQALEFVKNKLAVST
jgi:ectoine hydroxylase-related dioxygenase (phytanoyl-CoA dioxygenase family)